LLYIKDLASVIENKYKNIDFCGTLLTILVLYAQILSFLLRFIEFRGFA
jgi:hypothetical protein